MTDSDDRLSRRYRELPREEPSAEVDAAILAASRREVGAGPRARNSSWMVPASIAAVLVLGIGVSLRMQMEKPGIETSPVASEYSVPQTEAPREEAKPAEAKPAPERKALAKEKVRQAEAPPPAGVRKDAAEPNPFADAPIAVQPAVPASPPAVALSVPAAPPPQAPPPAVADRAVQPRAEGPTSAAGAAAPMQAAPAPRAKREAFADNAATRESRTLGAVADADPARELERIAKLREAARHEEADRALAEFRRRHPDYRIPEPMWERVKPR